MNSQNIWRLNIITVPEEERTETGWASEEVNNVEFIETELLNFAMTTI